MVRRNHKTRSLEFSLSSPLFRRELLEPAKKTDPEPETRDGDVVLRPRRRCRRRSFVSFSTTPVPPLPPRPPRGGGGAPPGVGSRGERPATVRARTGGVRGGAGRGVRDGRGGRLLGSGAVTAPTSLGREVPVRAAVVQSTPAPCGRRRGAGADRNVDGSTSTILEERLLPLELAEEWSAAAAAWESGRWPMGDERHFFSCTPAPSTPPRSRRSPPSRCSTGSRRPASPRRGRPTC